MNRKNIEHFNWQKLFDVKNAICITALDFYKMQQNGFTKVKVVESEREKKIIFTIKLY